MKNLLTNFISTLKTTALRPYEYAQDYICGRALSANRAKAGLAFKNVRIDGRSAAYLEREGKGETVVLLHGFSSSKDMWTSFVKNLPEEYRILVPDLPGHGDNAKDFSRNYTLRLHVQHLTEMIEKWGIKRFHMAGSSLGGGVARFYTAENPEKIITLTLFSSPGTFSSAAKSSRDSGLLFKAASNEDFDRLLNVVYHKPPVIPWPARPALARGYIRNVPLIMKILEDFLKEIRSYTEEDSLNLLTPLRMPVLVIWGDKDRILPASEADIYKSRLPDVEVVVMKDCGHMPQVEYSRESSERFARFARRAGS